MTRVYERKTRGEVQICWGGGADMVRVLVHWILNAAALVVVARLVEGFVISNWVSALIAVVVIGLFNATIGLLLKIITLPLGILTFGLFFLVINAFVLKFASVFVPGFRVETFAAAFWGALALAVLHVLFGMLGPNRRARV
ncbi:MAG TPA: phage holin family protein [Acidobacteriaceae bacterium]|nr:phage holin family protein [Acidobacteriaceae bacterium]